MPEPINIFIIYAREDKEVKHRLLAHLSPLKDAFNLSIWHDDYIEPGQEWKPHIESRLEHTDVFLLLVSVDFMNSEFIHQVEFKFAIDRHKSNKSIVIPVIINYCQWDVDIHFKEYTFNLSELQVLPQEGKPIDDWRTPAQALNDIARGVRVVLTSIGNKRQQDAEEKERQKALKKAKDQEENIYQKKADANRNKIIQEQTERQKRIDEKNKINVQENQHKTEDDKPSINKKILWSLIGLVVLIATGYLIFHRSNSPLEYSGNKVTDENRDTATTSTSTAPVMSPNTNNVRPLPASVIYSKGTITIHEPYAYDLDKGVKLSEENISTADFEWAHPTSMAFTLHPLAGKLHLISRKAAFGKAKFDAITKDYLSKLDYSKNSIGMDDLDKGVIVAVKTNQGRYCKFILLDGELDFTISWVTYE
jgi:hypothetical protein